MRLESVEITVGALRLGPLDLDVAEGEYFVVLGPTGAGKTLLLETITGLRSPRAGRVVVEGRDASGVAPDKRRIGFVYQDRLLFPHLTVAQNIAFGRGALRVRHLGRGRGRDDDTRRDVRELAAGLDIEALLDRHPATLSGGEQQRVALARALITRPRLLLLDEPLSAVDEQARRGLQTLLRRVRDESGVTVVHVTHSWTEAAAVADRCAVVGDGALQQVGGVADVVRRPANRFVAGLSGAVNLFAGSARPARADDGVVVDLDDGTSLVAARGPAGRVDITVRPEAILIGATAKAADNRWRGRVVALVDEGGRYRLTVTGPPTIEAYVAAAAGTVGPPAIGDEIDIGFSAEAVHLMT